MEVKAGKAKCGKIMEGPESSSGQFGTFENWGATEGF